MASGNLMELLKKGMMFAPPGACDASTDAACATNVKPVINSDNSIYHYYTHSNWDPDAADVPLVAAPGFNPVYVLSYRSADEEAALKGFQNSTAAAGSSSFAAAGARLFVKLPSPIKLWESVPLALRKGTGGVENIIPDHTSQEHSILNVVDSVDDCIRWIAVNYINLTEDDSVSVTFDDFGAKQRDRDTSAVEYFKAAPQLANVALYAALTKADKGVTAAAAARVVAKARVYYAFRFMDSIWAQRDRFFFLDRLVIMTKIVYLCNLISLAYDNVEDADKAYLEAQFYNLMKWVYARDIMQYIRSDLSDNLGLDDMFQRNVLKGQDIRNKSDELIDKQKMVQGIQDNLKSLENNDRMSARRKRNLYIMYIVMIVLGVALVASLGWFFVTGQRMMMYVTVSVISLSVLFVEAFKGLQMLLDA